MLNAHCKLHNVGFFVAPNFGNQIYSASFIGRASVPTEVQNARRFPRCKLVVVHNTHLHLLWLRSLTHLPT
uniref:Uncharacterized protein n=1 Tax=Meloidogyne incognita TaxID=6306 RepID=A0A914NNC7_MELIC